MISLLLLSAAVNAAPSMGMEPAQRDSQCMVAVRAEPNLGELAKPAATYFEARLNAAHDPELVELLTISAEEGILPNANRREIASTCLLLYQVLKLQDKPGRPPKGG